MATLTAYFSGAGLMARMLRSASWIVVGYGMSQALRLGSNLILTRLLFPEAFGLMALVTMVSVGLSLFSDMGIRPAIAQSKRGDDPDFLNTAWTFQVIRGFVLFGLTCLLAAPLAEFYEQPQLEVFLPIAGFSLIVSGFQPTRVATAHRHLAMGKVTALELAAQAASLVVMIGLAWWLESVAALIIGTVFQSSFLLIANHFFLPGERNTFRWERDAFMELFHFGKWIFLSTAFFFFTTQGDKAVLGKFLSIDVLGIYNIGFFLASFPIALGIHVSVRVLIPAYRERPPGESRDNFRKLARMRHVSTFGLLSMIFTMAMLGPWLISVLYDDRYILAGGIVVLMSLVKMVQAIGVTYDNSALAAGDSRQFFVFNASRGILQVTFLILGVTQFGLIGAILGFGLAFITAHPILVWLARRHRAWDPVHDAIWFTIAGILCAIAVWWNLSAIEMLVGI